MMVAIKERWIERTAATIHTNPLMPSSFRQNEAHLLANKTLSFSSRIFSISF